MMINRKITLKQPTCPWWFLFTFDNPLRRIYQNPERILRPYLKHGDVAVDIGCGMGYFTLPLARLVGEHGQVIAVDLQYRMLTGLKRRAEKANLMDRIKLHQCAQGQVGIPGPVDFVLAFWMVHEVHNSKTFISQIHRMLKSQGQLLIVEPLVHVSPGKFHQTVSEIQEVGFFIKGHPQIGFSRAILAQKDY